MRIIILSSFCQKNNASNIILDLNKNFILKGHKSHIISYSKYLDTIGYKSIKRNKLISFCDKISISFNKKFPFFGYRPSGHKIVREIINFKPDIINLHWIHGDYIPLNILFELRKVAPIILTIHDFIPLTGGCSLPGDCLQYFLKCKSCERNDLFFKGINFSSYIWKRKMNIFLNNIDATISPSKWLFNIVNNHPFFNKKTNFQIYHSIDTSIFKPIDKGIAKAKLNIDKQFLLLINYVNFLNPLKGINFIIESLNILHNQYPYLYKDLQIVGIGDNSHIIKTKIPFHYKPVKCIDSKKVLAMYYSAADVFLTGSTSETFGLTILESIACNTPVVAFKNSAIKELIMNNNAGYLAENKNPEDLSNGIQYFLNNKFDCKLFRNDYNQFLISEFEASKYIDCFKEVIK